MGNRRPNHRKRQSRGPKFIKARLILGAICILASLIFVYRSCLAGIFKEGAGLGLWGLIPSVLLFVAGVVAVQMLRSAAPMAFLIPSALCLLADITSLIHGAKAGEWKFWGILAAVIAVAFLLLLCLNKRKNLEAPYVFLGVTLVVTAAMLIFGGKSKAPESGDAAEGAGVEGAGTENAGEDASSDE